MRRHPVASFGAKQVGLEFPSFASKLVKERRQMVHIASSRRLHGREAKDDRFDGVGCDAVEIEPNYPLVVVVFISAHMSILVFCFHI
jgi:hypothetical protein